ncbi:DNA polymerase alpha/epsilon subunit B [Diplocarpon rosae]|nr:DNA polymerase alpha/epsilon subunit B [Diplocarpon rosae]
MSRLNDKEETKPAPIFKQLSTSGSPIAIPSSSPAFGTPVHPIRPFTAGPAAAKASILPIILPPATLRPLAFRTFTKKHSLTLTSSALQVIATFIGRHCGTGWREEGLAERVLEEVAKSWKNRNGGVIVDGEGTGLKEILKNLEGSMVSGRIVAARELSRQNSLVLGSSQNREVSHTRLGIRPSLFGREDSQSSLGLSTPDVEDEEDDDGLRDPRKWLKVIDAFEQPRLVYDVGKKHFDRETSRPSLLPQASHKTQVFRNRYNLIHQRLLRNESFQTPTFDASRSLFKRSSSSLATTQQAYKLTPIANLLGRNGTSHMLLGLLTISPTGTLAINDLTGSIALDLTRAKPIPEDGAWFAPGMIVLVDGTYEEDDYSAGGGLGGVGGVGGTIGEDTPMIFVLMGNFVQHAVMARGGSGGSIEYKEYFDGLAQTLSDYPTLLQSATFIFVPGDNDGWASAFSAGAATPLPRKSVPEIFTSRIKRAFATANAEAEKERGKKTDGEAIWTSNPSRLSLFGPTHEILLLRDNITSRLRRTAIKFSSQSTTAEDEDHEIDVRRTPPTDREPGPDMEVDAEVVAPGSRLPQPVEEHTVSNDLHAARKLVKTILDQGYLSPFGMAIRPVLWDYASSLQAYPLPTAMVLADTEAPVFCVTYEGCHVMNPGSIVAPGRRGVAKWVEYDIRNKAGKVREALF